MTFSHEIWKPVVGYEGFYEISNLGRLKRIARRSRGTESGPQLKKLTKTGRPGKKYLCASLNRPGKPCKFSFIHTLVAAAFLGPRPEGKQINHKNGDPSDNRPENLEYISPSENQLHAYKVLQRKKSLGSINGHATITESIAKEIKTLRKIGKTTREIASATGASKSVIDHILGGRAWTHVK